MQVAPIAKISSPRLAARIAAPNACPKSISPSANLSILHPFSKSGPSNSLDGSAIRSPPLHHIRIARHEGEARVMRLEKEVHFSCFAGNPRSYLAPRLSRAKVTFRATSNLKKLTVSALKRCRIRFIYGPIQNSTVAFLHTRSIFLPACRQAWKLATELLNMPRGGWQLLPQAGIRFDRK